MNVISVCHHLEVTIGLEQGWTNSCLRPRSSSQRLSFQADTLFCHLPHKTPWKKKAKLSESGTYMYMNVLAMHSTPWLTVDVVWETVNGNTSVFLPHDLYLTQSLMCQSWDQCWSWKLPYGLPRPAMLSVSCLVLTDSSVGLANCHVVYWHFGSDTGLVCHPHLWIYLKCGGSWNVTSSEMRGSYIL